MRSAGKAVPGAELKVVGEDGTELPRGEVGELVCKSPSNMQGYWNLPDATKGALKDGWNGFAVLQDTASRAGALDIGFAAGAGGLSLAQMLTFGTLDVLFLLGADDVKVPDGTFVVYIGTHGDRGAHARGRSRPTRQVICPCGVAANIRVALGNPKVSGQGLRMSFLVLVVAARWVAQI